MTSAPRSTQAVVAGVISDTHGLLRPQVMTLFRGSGILFHAGDIGNLQVVQDLRSIARVVAVRGNNDKGRWAKKFPLRETVEFAGVRFYVIHDLKELDLNPSAADFQVVISGHSHRPLIERRQGVLFVNPGSAGPRRFTFPISVARVTLTRAGVAARILEVPAPG